MDLDADHERQAKLDLAKIVASDSKRIAELEQDGKRLDWLEHLMLMADVRLERDWGYEIWKRKEGGKWNRIGMMPDLRQAIDMAMGEEKVSAVEGE